MKTRKFMSPLLISLICSVLGYFLLVVSASAQSHTYTGRGDTVFGARQDAIRTALQEQISQIVVADRAISDTDVIYDNIVSTMNGYVEDFEVLDVNRSPGGEFVINARISVSKQMIQNHISVAVSSSGEIDGEGLFNFLDERNANQQAAKLSAEANGYIFKRMFRGYPTDVFRVDLAKMEPAPPGRDQHLIFLELVVRPDPSFVEMVLSTLKSLSYGECAQEKYGPSGFDCSNILPRKRNIDRCRDSECVAGVRRYESIRLDYANAFPSAYGFSPVRVCAEYQSKPRCFIMKPGYYRQTSPSENMVAVFKPKVGIAVDLVDKQGASVLNSGNCLKYWAKEIRKNRPTNQPIVSRIDPTNYWWWTHLPFTDASGGSFAKDENEFDLSLDPHRIVIALDSREFNARNASEINMIVFHKLNDGMMFKSGDKSINIISAYQNRQRDLCNIVRQSRHTR